MSEDNRAFRGVWIPADLWLDRNISVQEKIMLVEIDSLQHPERGCFKSNKKLAAFFDLTASRVSQIITSLESRGYVRVVQVRNGKQVVERRVFMVQPLSQLFSGKNPKEGYLENCENPSKYSKEGYLENAQERGSGLGVQKEGLTISANALRDAFDVFWKSVHNKKDKARAERYFNREAKRHGDPMAFANMLIEDMAIRLKAGQQGFAALHPTTYLNNKRWEDERPELCPHDEIIKLWNSTMPNGIEEVSVDDWTPDCRGFQTLAVAWEAFKTKPRASTGKPVFESEEAGLQFYGEVFRRLAKTHHANREDAFQFVTLTWAVQQQNTVKIFKGDIQ